MRNTKRLFSLFKAAWDYVRPCWEGYDGKLSLRRVISVLIMIELYTILRAKSFESEFGFYTFLTLVITVLLLVGIITVQNIIEGIRAYKGGSISNEPASGSECIENGG